MKASLVSTIRRWDQQTVDWVAYHRAIGFKRIYVFLDDPPIEAIVPPDGVRITACDLNWWHSFAGHVLYDDLNCDALALTEAWLQPQFITLRQMLNAERAIEWALEDAVSWLLHIDVDELFYTGKFSAAEHFQTLERAQIGQAVYLNHEAIARDIETPLFTSLTLFRKNHAMLSREQQQYTDAQFPGRPWFLAYSNGKSAVKVSPDIKPAGAHGFRAGKFVGCCTVGAPVILHYPYSSYKRFREKHVSLGMFDADRFFGEPWKAPPLLKRAQEYLRHGDESALKKLYQEWILVEPEDRCAMLRAGVAEEIQGAANLMLRLTHKPGEQRHQDLLPLDPRMASSVAQAVAPDERCSVPARGAERKSSTHG